MSEKKIPAIRFKGVTDGWEKRKLSNVVDSIDTGKSKFDKQRVYGKYPILGSTSIIGYDDEYDYDGDFILTARVGANAGSLYRHTGKVKISDNTVFIQALQNIKFIYQIITKFDIKKLSFGTGQPLVKASDLKNLELIVPTDIDEQVQIGDYFHNLDYLIILHQRKLTKLQLLKKSMLTKMFPKDGARVPEIRFQGFHDDWKQKKFGNENFLITGYPFESEKYVNEGITLIRGMNVKRGFLDLSDGICMKWSSSKGFENYLLKNDDILIQMDGALIGKSYAKITKNQLPALLVQRVTRARVKKYIADADFMYQTIQKDFLPYIKLNKTETAVPHLSLNDIRNFTIMVPSFNEQQKIGAYFNSLDKLINLHQRKLSKLQQIKQAMLSKLFV